MATDDHNATVVAAFPAVPTLQRKDLPLACFLCFAQCCAELFALLFSKRLVGIDRVPGNFVCLAMFDNTGWVALLFPGEV